MARYEYVDDGGFRAELLDELIRAGITDALVQFPDDRTAWVMTEFAKALVDPVVADHNPAAYEADEAAKRRTYDDAVAFLKTFYQTPNASITVDQAKNAIKALTVIARAQHEALRLDS